METLWEELKHGKRPKNISELGKFCKEGWGGGGPSLEEPDLPLRQEMFGCCYSSLRGLKLLPW